MSDPLARLQTALRGRYLIERELGQGGMSIVYLARDVKHDRQVAIKVLKPEIASALGAERFVREIRIAARLQHPNILPLYDSGKTDGVLYYVMPYVEGESLRERLHREKQLPIEDAIQITREVADALSYAHSHDVVHRDIKPANILLAGHHAIVADFGVARAIRVASDRAITSAGVAVGTPAYMSPEQATGAQDIDARSDVYALGCVLYEMLAGEPPYTGSNSQAVMAKHISAPVPQVRTVRETIPEFVDSTVSKALAKTAADRFATAQQLSDALISGGSLPGVIGVSGGVESEGATLWRRAAVALGGALVVIGGILVVSNLNQEGRGETTVVTELDPHRVAVLYFDDRSEGEDLEYLAESFTEDLIDALSHVSALSVVPRNGVAAYRGGDVPSGEIAQILAAGTLVDGTVEATAAGIRVTVRLIDADPLEQLESMTLTAQMGDVFSLREAITDSVSRFLRETLGEEIRAQVQRAATDNVEAWELVQRAERDRKAGAELRSTGDIDGARSALDRGEVLLLDAQRLDPRWVKPIVLQGWLTLDRVDLWAADGAASGASDTASVFSGFRRAIAHAERALELQSSDPEVLELRGIARYRLWDPPVPGEVDRQSELLRAAEEDLRAAGATHQWPARLLSTLSDLVRRKGDFEQAWVLAQQAWEADEFLAATRDVTFQLSQALLEVGRFSQAADLCRDGRSRYPGDPRFSLCSLTALSSSDTLAPDADSAWSYVAEMVERSRPQAKPLYQASGGMMVAMVLARAGSLDSAVNVMNTILSKGPYPPRMWYYEAAGWLRIGERDRAFDALESHLRAMPQRRTYIASDLWFGDLRDDPRFRALVDSASAGR